jgi:hypothetical protein
VIEDPLLKFDMAALDESTNRRPWLVVAFIAIPLALCVYAIVAAKANQLGNEFSTARTTCSRAVASAADTVEAADQDARDRSVRHSPRRGTPFPGLSTTFDTVQTDCLDQPILRLAQYQKQFTDVRGLGQDAWHYDGASPANDGPSEEQMAAAPLDVLMQMAHHLASAEPPSLLDAAGELVGIDG